MMTNRTTTINKVKVLYFLIGTLLFLSCYNSNALKQDKAENTIKHFLEKNAIKTTQGIVSVTEISNIGDTNIFSQFNSSVKVDFKDKNYSLLFIFTRTTANKWYLESIESSINSTEWVKTKKNLHIPVD